MQISLRPLTTDDASLVFEWRNDPFISGLGSSQKKVSWDEHVNWIRDTVKGDPRKAFLIVIDNIEAGQVRFDRDTKDPSACVISVYLLEKFTGKGAGTEAIRLGCRAIKAAWGNELVIYAYVINTNTNSHKSFVKAGFSVAGRDDKHVIYEYNSPQFKEDDLANEKVYEDLYAKHGNTLQTLNWGSKESQFLRFKVLSEMGDLRERSVLDVGCGFGDYYQYLSDKGVPVRYTGVDITKPIIAAAKERFPQLNFLHGSLLELDNSILFDYVFASGIYTYRSKDEYGFLQIMTKSMFAHCTKGVAFNCLSSWTASKDEGEFYADPLRVIEFCKTLSPWVSLRHDYHSRDFTIFIYKERNI